MPKYYKYKDLEGLHIKVSPIKRLLGFLPFYDGDQPQFSIKIRRLRKDAPSIGGIRILEKLPGKTKSSLLQVIKAEPKTDKIKLDITNTTHQYEEGGLAYKISIPINGVINKPLLTARVFSRDKRNVNLMYMAATSILTCFLTAVPLFAMTGIAPDSPIGKRIYTPVPTSTPTATPTIIPTPTQTPIPTTTLTSTNTPTPVSMNELKICKQPETQFPCRYYIRDGDIGSTIAEKVYGKDHIDQAGRIVELYRDENGEIMTIITGNEIVIPDWNIPLDEQYYEYYFQIISNPIRKCDARFWFPCWYVSDGEPLDILIGLPDPDINEKCFLQANRSTYNTRTGNTEIKAIGEGIIFVYPVCQ